MDPEQLQALGRGFWYRWAAGMSVGTAGVLGGGWLVGGDAWLAAVYGLIALLFVGFAAVSLAVGERVDGAGQVVSAVGFAAVGVATVQEFPDPLFWGGWVLAVAGAAVGLASDVRGGGRDAAES